MRTHKFLLVAVACTIWTCAAQAEQIRLSVDTSRPVLLAGSKQTAYLKIGLAGGAQAERLPVRREQLSHRSVADQVEVAAQGRQGAGHWRPFHDG